MPLASKKRPCHALASRTWLASKATCTLSGKPTAIARGPTSAMKVRWTIGSSNGGRAPPPPPRPPPPRPLRPPPRRQRHGGAGGHVGPDRADLPVDRAAGQVGIGDVIVGPEAGHA